MTRAVCWFRTRLPLALAIMCLAGSGCGKLSKEERSAITSWLLCDECVNGQRARVVALRNKAVPTLGQALRGPSRARLENMRRKFAESYGAGGGLSEEAYVALLLDGYVTLYQKRSAVVLADIGTGNARRELQLAVDSAAGRGYRTDVLREIEAALARASLERFAGSLSDTVVGFGDTVIVRRGRGLSWDGDESVVLHGAAFPDELELSTPPGWDQDDSLRFVAVGETGTYTLLVTGLGPKHVSQAAPLHITSLAYEPRPPGAAPLVTAGPLPTYLALGVRPGDTTDFFRFQPATHAMPRFTATVRWRGLQEVSLWWRRCGGTTPLVVFPVATRITGRVVDERDGPLAGAAVSVLATNDSVVTDAQGGFQLSGIPTAAASGGVVALRVSKQGFRTAVPRVQAGTDSLRIGLVSSTATRATARNVKASSVVVPGNQCWLLQVATRGGTGVRMIRLRITSP